jgi:hypothetical protein
MKKLLVVSALALGLAAARGIADDKGGCELAHANPKESPTKVPFDDKDKMKELQGLDGKGNAHTTITFPKEGEKLEKGEGVIKFTVENYTTGKNEEGKFQHCHIILNNKPYVADYDKTTKLEDLNVVDGKPTALPPGDYLLTIFPARNFHLSLKNPGACAQVRFHVLDKDKKMPPASGPMKEELPGARDPQIIYSRPKGAYDSKIGENKAILLDFYILNIKLGVGGVYVTAKVDDAEGKEVEKLEIKEWWPQLILKDAKPGKYKVTLTLQGPGGKPIDAPFNPTTRDIEIK